MKQHEDTLDAALRRNEPAIGDGGFSDRVLARLPPRHARRTVPRRWTLAGAAAAGSVATILLAPTVESVTRRGDTAMPCSSASILNAFIVAS